jgi:hypothetical protein
MLEKPVNVAARGDAMHLYWLVFKHGTKTEVVIQPAHSMVAARLMAGVHGQDGEFQEGHVLDSNIAEKIPMDVIGKTLTTTEAKRLLKKL